MSRRSETWTGADLPAPLSPVYPDPMVPERRPTERSRFRQSVAPAITAVVVLAAVVGFGVAMFTKDRPSNQERIDRCISRGGTALLDHEDRYDGCRIPSEETA